MEDACKNTTSIIDFNKERWSDVSPRVEKEIFPVLPIFHYIFPGPAMTNTSDTALIPPALEELSGRLLASLRAPRRSALGQSVLIISMNVGCGMVDACMCSLTSSSSFNY